MYDETLMTRIIPNTETYVTFFLHFLKVPTKMRLKQSRVSTAFLKLDLALSYFDNSLRNHYRRRWVVSPLSSRWMSVGPTRH
jgi:hypothetical protein